MTLYSKDHPAAVLLVFSLPLILSGMLQQLYSWADAYIVGHVVGEEALAAVGMTTAVSNLFTMSMTGFTPVSYTHLDVYKRQLLICDG